MQPNIRIRCCCSVILSGCNVSFVTMDQLLHLLKDTRDFAERPTAGETDRAFRSGDSGRSDVHGAGSAGSPLVLPIGQQVVRAGLHHPDVQQRTGRQGRTAWGSRRHDRHSGPHPASKRGDSPDGGQLPTQAPPNHIWKLLVVENKLAKIVQRYLTVTPVRRLPLLRDRQKSAR